MRPLSRLLRIVLMCVQGLWLLISLYQSTVTLLGQRRRRRFDKVATPRFAIIICARDEEDVIGGIVGDLQRQSYPTALTEVLVVAHNCTDATADAARHAGAPVHELRTARPGKSQAVLAGLTQLRADCDLVGVVDADARVPEGFLSAVADASPGESCLQVETRPRKSGDWLADGYGFGRRARNVFWWRPREELGLGTTLSGSGFFMRPALLQSVLSRGRTVTEDLEATALLAADGVRVRYVSHTFIEVEEPHRFGDSMRQRSRWARGHVGVIRHTWPSVARQALRGDLGALDTAIFLVVPTRVLTRTAITGSAVLRISGSAAALPAAPLLIALSGEWVLPAAIAIREKLLPLSTGGMKLALRHGVLSLLWFPVGTWAVLTASERSWERAARLPNQEADAVEAH